MADLPSEYWQIQRLIKFLKVRVASLLKQATNRGKQYDIRARKRRMKKAAGFFIVGRVLETSAERKQRIMERQNSPFRISPFALAFLNR